MFFWAGNTPIHLAKGSAEYCEQRRVRTSSPGLLPNRFKPLLNKNEKLWDCFFQVADEKKGC